MTHAPAGAGPLVRVLPQTFFRRASHRVAPDLIGCLLVRRLPGGELRWGVIVETEAYSQSEPACHGHHRRTASNETLFAAPGCFYVYRIYGIHQCVNVVTGRRDWADGVLLRAAAVTEGERLAAGPALLARHFGIDHRHDGASVSGRADLWLARRPAPFRRWWEGQTGAGRPPLVTTTRIGIRLACELPWRWYLAASRSVSRRRRGDRRPPPARCWTPESLGLP